MAKYIEEKTPYDIIADEVGEWCEENGYTTMLVTISLGYKWEAPHEETQLLDWDGAHCQFVWDMDWWEGQQHVELVGFAPLHKIKLHGVDADVAPVRYGRWKREENWETGFGAWVNVCSACDAIVPVNVSRYKYCPNCGALMDKEVDE